MLSAFSFIYVLQPQMKSKPSEKHCVQMFMSFVRKETQNLAKTFSHKVSECLKLDRCRNNPLLLMFHDCSGYINPFDHLISTKSLISSRLKFKNVAKFGRPIAVT